jgi:methylmalonyl-CoA/ethylmalonyl-CoA epimerase
MSSLVPGAEKIDHIGIAVKDLDACRENLQPTCWAWRHTSEKQWPHNKVITSFFKVGESKIELLFPTAPESPIAKFLHTKGEGMHHTAFLVTDIEASLAQLKAQGFRLIHETPILGADQKRIAFVHPKDTTGVLIELCEQL